jgi:ribosomal protein S18 acetylase RimI-like enzyme
MILAMEKNDVAGCVAMRPLSPEICEMKRLYVKPEQRGKNIGRMLAAKIIQAAIKCGYERMRLDTVPSMKPAQKLYESMGFKQIAAYRHNPVPGATYLELKLSEFSLKGR